MQTALRGDYDLQRVATELRAQWPESELVKRDRSGRGASYMGEAVDLDEDLEAYEADYDPEDLRDEGMTEEGLVLMDENEGMAQEAMAAIQHGNRTLKEGSGQTDGGPSVTTLLQDRTWEFLFEGNAVPVWS